MALEEDTLANELENLVPTTNAAAAIQTLADTYGTYMNDAVAGGNPILTVAAAVTAMAGAMSFPVPGTAAGAAAAISAGVAAFWAAMVAAPATYFTGATLIVIPTGLAGLTAALTPVLVSNVGKSLEDSAAALAEEMHAATTGPVAGNATFPGPVVADII